MAQPSKAVFLSYASQDAEAARRICAALRAAGMEVWFDQSELRGGDAWDRQIRKQIRESALLIPIISATTQSRSEGYFRLEWKLAVERTHLMSERVAFLLPVVIDDTRDAGADVPDKFREVQWTRLPGGNTPEVFVKHVARLLAADTVRANEPSTGPPRAAVSARPRWNLTLIAVVAVIALGLVIGSWLVHRISRIPLQAGLARPSTPSTLPSLPAPPVIPEKSVAVLPFADMSEKKDQEYFADGLSEELIDMLSKVPDLRVPARTSSFYFKDRNDTVEAMAQQLKVANVLEGSVRKAGDRLRISAQLIHADDGYNLWSETYDRQAKDIFKVQDEITAAVVEALKAALVPAARTQYQESNADAYASFLKGNYFAQRGGTANFVKALSLFQAAISLDSRYALASVRVGEMYRALAGTRNFTAADANRDALKAALLALEIAPDLSDAHRLRGEIYRDVDWDWAGARSEFEKAIELDTNDLWARDDLAFLTAILTTNFADSIDTLRQDLARNPLDAGAYRALGGTYWAAGRLQESAATFEQLFVFNSEYPTAHAWYGNTLLFMHKNAQALAELNKETQEDNRILFLPSVYWALGRSADADAALLKLRTKYGESNPFYLAMAYAFRNDADAAFEWLERGYQSHGDSMTEIKFNPYLRNLRGDPRYKALLRRMNLPQ